MLRATVSVILAAALYFANVGRAAACSCVESAGVSDDLAQSGSVFEGKVTRLHHEPAHHRLTARVQVLRRWKGAAPAAVEVVTIDQGSLCGFGFERGKTYLLFTPEAEGTLSVSLCSRSKASEQAAADFAELDRLVASGPHAAAPMSDAGTDAAAPAPASTAPPSPVPESPAPVPLSEPATGTTEPGRGGCAGCSAVSSPTTPGYAAALALLLVCSLRRSRGRALNAPAIALPAQGKITRMSGP